MLGMRSQEITPWSIYNHTLRIKDNPSFHQEQKQIRFPKIGKTITQRERHEAVLTIRRHSSLALGQNGQKSDEKSEPLESHASESTVLAQSSRWGYIKSKQQEIEKKLHQYAAVRSIRQQLKRQASQIDFLRILQQHSVQQQQQSHIAPLQIVTKERSFLLDHHAFPKLTHEKNIVLVNMREGEGSHQDLSQSKIKQLLKKQISSMISNRMKVMGRIKKINQKA